MKRRSNDGRKHSKPCDGCDGLGAVVEDADHFEDCPRCGGTGTVKVSEKLNERDLEAKRARSARREGWGS